MNKATINRELPFAYDAISECGISEDNKTVQKTYRGLVSSFGAAVTMGSLEAAVCYFSDNGNSDVNRSALTDAILKILKKDGKVKQTCETLYEYASSKASDREENIVNAAIALKFAMNLYTLTKGKGE